jgi:hypothetical protein
MKTVELYARVRHAVLIERLTGALLDRLTHHVHILEMKGDHHFIKMPTR